jgi:hypothetical protein
MLTLCSLSPSVAMVEPAEAWQRSHAGAADFPSLDRTPAGRVFAPRVVDAVLLVQVINATPILSKSVKSGTRGILGAAVQ